MIDRRIHGAGEPCTPPLGLGCWAIGGKASRGDEPMGWGEVDDRESIAAIHRALELGVDLFDTADMYGCGHSERILGQALATKRNQVTLVTKFGYRFDEDSRQITGQIRLPDDLEKACDASLSRLKIDAIDVYLLHLRDLDLVRATEVRDALEDLVGRGKIRGYGWSTDDPARAELFQAGPHCVAIEQAYNLFQGDRKTLDLCEAHGLTSLQRSPLAMGILSGRFSASHRAADDDVRARFDFGHGPVRSMLEVLDLIRPHLASEGRTLVQGALAWLWANSAAAIPIPGFRTVSQVEDLAGAMALGPLGEEAMEAIRVASADLGALPANPWDLGGSQTHEA